MAVRPGVQLQRGAVAEPLPVPTGREAAALGEQPRQNVPRPVRGVHREVEDRLVHGVGVLPGPGDGVRHRLRPRPGADRALGQVDARGRPVVEQVPGAAPVAGPVRRLAGGQQPRHPGRVTAHERSPLQLTRPRPARFTHPGPPRGRARRAPRPGRR